MKKSKSNLSCLGKITNTLGIISIGGLALLAIPCLIPETTLQHDADALVIDCNGRECDAITTIKTDVNVGTVISLGLGSYIGVDIVPKSGGAFASESTRLTVATNSPEGYSLYMQTIDGTSKLSNITNPEQTNAVINPLTSEVDGNIISSNPDSYANQWGYSLDSTTSGNIVYKPVPTNQSSPIKVTTGMSGANTSASDEGTTNLDSYDLSFGVSVDTNLPAGTYSNKVLVSAVANPVTITNLNQLVYMQDMTPDICANTAYDSDGHMTKETADLHNPVTKRLVDTRDGNKYWVAKLADGNCWMTQNLALDITEAMVSATGNSGLLNSNTTDIGYDNNGQLIDGVKYWNADSEYPPIPTGTKNADGRYDSAVYPDYIAAQPTVANTCADDGKSFGAWTAQKCTENGVLAYVPGWDPAGEYSIKNQEIVTYDTEKQSYDSHYLVGGHYNRATATAGSSYDITPKSNAPDSICPKGWKMPSGGNLPEVPESLVNASGNYRNLMLQYGLTYGSYGVGISTDHELNSNLNGDGFNLNAAPLYFVRAGITGSGTPPTLANPGVGGMLQSATSGALHKDGYLAVSAVYVFDRNVSDTLAYTNSGEGSTISPRSIRCIAY